MSTTVVVNGLNYFIPAVGENNWGQNVTDALVALATAASSNASVFNRVTVTSSPITVVSGRTYLVDTTAARTLNLPTPANNAYLFVKDITGTAKSNNITIHRAATEKINGTAADYVCSVNSGHWLFVSDGTDWFLVKDPDITPYAQLNLAGSIVNADVASGAAISYSKLNLATSILNSDINGSAAIAVNKLAALTVSKAVATDASGFLTTVATTPTELGYVSGVTSAIQTQLGTKLPTTGGTLDNGATPTASELTIKANSSGALSFLTYAQDNIQQFFDAEWIASGVVARSAACARFRKTTTSLLIDSDTGLTSGNAWNPTNRWTLDLATGNITQVGNLAFSPTTKGIVGTNTNDNATAGNIGESIKSSSAANNALPATNTYGDATSISLTAGDWDVSALIRFNPNTATLTDWEMGISTTSGNSNTGLNSGDSLFAETGSLASPATRCLSIPCYRMSLSGTTTVYLKLVGIYASGAPFYQYRLSARRVR